MKEDEISYVINNESRKAYELKVNTNSFSPSVAKSVRAFHESISRYEPTPLFSLARIAAQFKVSNIWIKDESFRFGLNAFKVLGASYALARLLARRFDVDTDLLSFDLLQSGSLRRKLQNLTLVTGTDGNHGRAVAWSADLLGCRSVVYVPKGISKARFEAIESHGSQVIIIDGNYDDAVHLAASKAEEHAWILVQDSSWEGYTEIPTWIMQGYLTMIDEALEQLGGKIPTHVFAQCGVGSFAASLQAYFFERFGNDRPLFVVVEPSNAACFHESIRDFDGKPKKASGDLKTVMAGLACGEPSLLAWEILRDYADVFIACPDHITVRGMRILSDPPHGDTRLVSGESGAVTLGLLVHVRTCPLDAEITSALRLDDNSEVLLVSTEGDTDPEMYRKLLGSDTQHG